MTEQYLELQNGLDTFTPDQTGILMFLGGVGEVMTWLIPVRPTLRHWAANQYNLEFRPIGLINNPRDPLPQGRLQIAVYRAIIPDSPFPAMATTIAQMVPGTYYDTGTLVLGGSLVTKPDFEQEVIVLGGTYWIVIRVEDTTESGSNTFQWGYQGWTLADSNLWCHIFVDQTMVGTLPPTYSTAGLIPCPNNYPYIRCDWW